MRLSAHGSPDDLRAKAAKCRQLAKGADDLTRANLIRLADAHDDEARGLEPPRLPDPSAS